jgi:hypothetical protein
MPEYADQQDQSPYGQEFLAWEYDVRPRYDRGTWWHVGMLGGGAALLLIALISANFLFALIVVMFALVVYLASIAVPERRRFAVTEEGILAGNRLYPYKDLESFWFAYDPPTVRKLYLPLRTRGGLLGQTVLTVQLEDVHPNQVRAALLPFVGEDPDNETEPPLDKIIRMLKLG